MLESFRLESFINVFSFMLGSFTNVMMSVLLYIIIFIINNNAKNINANYN